MSVLNRRDVIAFLGSNVDEDTIIVTNIADASFELFQLADRAQNFYMLGSFGLAPSIAQGLALAMPQKKVIAINGDGALLYNLGALTTQKAYPCKNLLHVVVDNGAHGATGYQATATTRGISVRSMAEGCGLATAQIDNAAALEEAWQTWQQSQNIAVLVAKTQDPPPEKAPLPSLSGEEIRARFMQALGTES